MIQKKSEVNSKTHSSNEKKKYINESLNFTFKFYNKLINKKILGFVKLKKTYYKINIDKGNNYIFSQYLKKEIIVIIYNFCKAHDKKRLLIVYVICKIKNYNYLIEQLEMNFGEFLYKSGFPFSDEYKIKHYNLKIEEKLKFPNSKIYFDKMRQRKNSKKDKIIETIPDDEVIIKKFNLNVSEISANNNINNDYINELIKKGENQMNISENSTSNNTNDNNNNNNNDDFITEYESVNLISNKNCQEQVDNNSINQNCENYSLYDENYEKKLYADLYLKKE